MQFHRHERQGGNKQIALLKDDWEARQDPYEIESCVHQAHKEDASAMGTSGAEIIVMVERWSTFCTLHRGKGLCKGNQS